MSILCAALNPNISDAQLLELIKRDGDAKIRMIESFTAGVDKLETREQKARYISTCLPVLISFMF